MKKEYIYAAVSILLWSTVAVTTKLLLGSLDSIQLLWASSFFAGIFLLITNIATGNIKQIKNFRLKDFLISIVIGLPGTFFYYVFYYAGADILPASQAFIINYLWPIMCVVFACIILKEKMTVRKAIAIAMSFLGVVIVTGSELIQLNPTVILGAVLCMLGAISYGVFTSLNQKFSYNKSISMMLNYFVTFILTTIINGMNSNLFFPSLVQTAGFIWNGMFTMALACTSWVLALESGKTAKISNLAYITPFLSLVWTSIILKEELHMSFIVGLVVIVAGIFVQLNEKPKRKI